MKSLIIKAWTWLFAMFDNHSQGLSARKFVGILGVFIAWQLSLKFGDATTVIELTWGWLLFALLCLAIITASQLIAIKSGGKTTVPDTSDTSSDITSSTTSETKELLQG